MDQDFLGILLANKTFFLFDISTIHTIFLQLVGGKVSECNKMYLAPKLFPVKKFLHQKQVSIVLL